MSLLLINLDFKLLIKNCKCFLYIIFLSFSLFSFISHNISEDITRRAVFLWSKDSFIGK